MQSMDYMSPSFQARSLHCCCPSRVSLGSWNWWTLMLRLWKPWAWRTRVSCCGGILRAVSKCGNEHRSL
ncbi:hypothetical protein BU25DRAFT_482551 [Macroventuria anomochaeta]|uniref:Uncharacterized protein n=1 Tax=Macroventuria anomochaeta TaxID=301207 RepID=A0ACB6RKW1_9PLEO|nr:uncharacterized protein BU25DRAFT_482551 [Macroventuria anomochaeta]KAF2621609.1 hypothetical protein BU25DRAFT_482551 [Macroventuria anomochaeta]